MLFNNLIKANFKIFSSLKKLGISAYLSWEMGIYRKLLYRDYQNQELKNLTGLMFQLKQFSSQLGIYWLVYLN